MADSLLAHFADLPDPRHARGRLVHVLSTGAERAPGPYRMAWNGRDHRGEVVPSGVYFLRYADPAGLVVRRFVVTR